MFCAWKSSGGLGASVAEKWAWEQFHARFSVGSMRLKDADASFFTGRVAPLFCNPACGTLGPHCYDELDNFPLKPWSAWAPRKQCLTCITGLLCRTWYFCNSRQSRIDAFWEVFVSLVLRAGFPWPVVRSRAAAWAAMWIPRGHVAPCADLTNEISEAISRFVASQKRVAQSERVIRCKSLRMCRPV